MLLVRGLRAFGLMAGAALMSLTAAADPQPAKVNATSYLHDGPGRQYRVLDELATDSPVRILACDRDWCRVQSGNAVGYLPRAAVASEQTTPARTSLAKPEGEACVGATEAGDGAGLRYSYCPRQ